MRRWADAAVAVESGAFVGVFFTGNPFGWVIAAAMALFSAYAFREFYRGNTRAGMLRDRRRMVERHLKRLRALDRAIKEAVR